METELDGMHTNLTKADKEIQRKVERDEIKKLWDHFQRFAEYKDLKHLHSIVIPEIVKFEQKIINNDKKLNQYDEIIRNYDEVIQTKFSKISFNEYKIQVA